MRTSTTIGHQMAGQAEEARAAELVDFAAVRHLRELEDEIERRKPDEVGRQRHDHRVELGEDDDGGVERAPDHAGDHRADDDEDERQAGLGEAHRDEAREDQPGRLAQVDEAARDADDALADGEDADDRPS